jgi:Uma2 family endonuclease
MVVKAPLKPERVETPAQVTGEELFQMGNIGRAELVKGELIKMSPTGYLHGRIENRFGVALDAFVRKSKLGVVFVGEVGIYTSRNPDTVRGADVAFVSHQRLAQVKSDSYLDVAPELVVEIMSPNDSWSEVMGKLEEYFNIGVVTVWVADPEKQQVYVYHSLTKVERFTINDILPGGEALSDFSVLLAELFATE